MRTLHVTIELDHEALGGVTYDATDVLDALSLWGRLGEIDYTETADLTAPGGEVIGRRWAEPTLGDETFDLHIALGSEGMRSEADVADALERAAAALRMPCPGSEYEGLLRDENGSAVGYFGLASGPPMPEEDPVLP